MLLTFGGRRRYITGINHMPTIILTIISYYYYFFWTALMVVVQCRPTQDALLGTPAVKGREETARTIAHPPTFRFVLTRTAYCARRLTDAASGWLAVATFAALSLRSTHQPPKGQAKDSKTARLPPSHIFHNGAVLASLPYHCHTILSYGYALPNYRRVHLKNKYLEIRFNWILLIFNI